MIGAGARIGAVSQLALSWSAGGEPNFEWSMSSLGKHNFLGYSIFVDQPYALGD